MLSSPLLTIAIPTLNRAYCLRRSLESALAQTAKDIEIIISDNGSTDDTALVVSSYNDPRLRRFHRSKTISAAAHGNFLIEQSRGRFFLGLSDDDFLEPCFAEKVLDFYENHPNLSFVYTGCWIHYKNIAVPAITGPEIEDGADFVYAFYKNQRNICWCACTTRLEHLRRIGPIPEGTIFGDMFYWTKIAFLGPVGCINKSLSNYIFMGDSMSSSVPVPEWANESKLIANETFERYCANTKSIFKKYSLRVKISQFLALSIGNQFAWNALYGKSRLMLVIWALQMLRFFITAPWALLQVVASLILPKKVLYSLIISKAIRLRDLRLKNNLRL